MLYDLLVSLCQYRSRAEKMPNVRPWISLAERQDCALNEGFLFVTKRAALSLAAVAELPRVALMS